VQGFVIPVKNAIFWLKNIYMMSYQIKIVPHCSVAYCHTVLLRDAILRKPLGLVFTPEQLRAENNDIHVACFEGDKLVGCLILVPHDNGKVKMRQVAVAESHQRKGIGTLMCKFSHQWAIDNNYASMYCHARDVAEPFYTKLGYSIISAPFTEVNIKHWKMEKKLQ
jgi:predicted GNAT family N-acyltransferase